MTGTQWHKSRRTEQLLDTGLTPLWATALGEVSAPFTNWIAAEV